MTINSGIIRLLDRRSVVGLLFMMKTKFKRLFLSISLNFKKTEKWLFAKYFFISHRKDFRSQTGLFICLNTTSQ
jgi:coproporphyrinogen III oxidase